MGCIKSTLIKRTAEHLLEQMPDAFSSSFENNKKVLAGTMPSKRVRNRIAGYLARIKKSYSKQNKA